MNVRDMKQLRSLIRHANGQYRRGAKPGAPLPEIDLEPNDKLSHHYNQSWVSANSWLLRTASDDVLKCIAYVVDYQNSLFKVINVYRIVCWVLLTINFLFCCFFVWAAFS